jgi:hypothetical protein
MAVVTLYSTALTNSKAVPPVQNPRGLEHGALRRSQGFANVASGNTTASIYAICRVRSCDYVDRIRMVSADIGTTTAADVGLYKIKSDGTVDTVVDVDFFGSAVNLAGGAIDSDVTFEAAAAGGLYTNAEKRIWEALGLSSDPYLEYYVCLTLTGDADAAGTVLVRLYTCN